MPIDRRTLLRAGAGAAALAMTGASQAFAGTRTAGIPPWEALRDHLDGTLVLPYEAGYARARQQYWSEFDSVLPEGVAYCASARDVATCLLFAQDHGLPVAPRSGGHSPAGYSTTAGLVIDVSRLNTIAVNPSTVTVGAGVQQIDALSLLAPGGLALTGGSCPTVGVAGFVQGGGYGLLTRRYGMACDRLVSAEAVLTDGRTVRCSADVEPDLYWALRGGGGGNFGVVTSFELTPVSIDELGPLTRYALSWPWDAAADAIVAWQEWIRDAPRALGTQLTVALSDAGPGATPVVGVSGAYSGDPGPVNALLDRLVSLTGRTPSARTTETAGYQTSMMSVYGCADRTSDQCHRIGSSDAAELPRGAYLLARNRMFGTPVPRAGVERILAAFDADRATGHTRSIACAALGGKVDDLLRTETAYVHRDTRFLMVVADGLPYGAPGPDARAAAEAWTAGCFSVLSPYSNGEAYQNYPDPALTDWRSSYYKENYDRLVAVKRHYDPHGFLRFPQAIG
ncbi:FAD-binding oxidoreductase [Streptomyces achromogenes]|uniref:FAD-binding oxidoreductase n=1 Tax=Streptomyces achromogenes TaxID=67255 RepID=UPI003703473B